MLGPTAAGKSDVALEIARRCRGEVVSVDSMQVYRDMDIGTAKATPAMRAEVPHHLIDVCDPDYDMAVAEFQRLGRAVLDDLERRQRVAVICGGSGLHFRSLVDPLEFPPNDRELRAELELLSAAELEERLVALDPDAGVCVDLANPRRVIRALEIALLTGQLPSQRSRSPQAEAVRNYDPVVDFVAVGLDPGPELAVRVEDRFDRMLDAGLVDEVAGLQGRMGRLAAQAVGYRQLLPVVAGDIDLGTGRQDAIRVTKAFAKRQRTFFRRDPRILWLPWHEDEEARVETAIAELNGRLSWTL